MILSYPLWNIQIYTFNKNRGGKLFKQDIMAYKKKGGKM